MFTNRLIWALALSGTLVLVSGAQAAEVKFYSQRKQGALVRVRPVFRADQPGCHTFPLARDVHRVAVLGFKRCTLYSARRCESGSELRARWKHKEKTTTTELTEGSRWYLVARGNVTVRAWNCVE